MFTEMPILTQPSGGGDTFLGSQLATYSSNNRTITGLTVGKTYTVTLVTAWYSSSYQYYLDDNISFNNVTDFEFIEQTQNNKVLSGYNTYISYMTVKFKAGATSIVFNNLANASDLGVWAFVWESA